jgi:2-alkyl-3-oxoalkanoate reductase
LGSALARALKARGDDVRILARGSYPEFEGIQGDICDRAAVEKAVFGRDVVFHTAAKVGLWGRYEDYYRTNVEGTKVLLDACRRARVQRFVFTGSPSVVFDGGDCDGWDETAGYPARFDSSYSRTKALSEEIVLAANGPDLWTISLRPHLIWGPGDRHIVPRLIERGRAGKLRRIGDLDKRVDTTYIDDAVAAHVLAADRLGVHPDPSGKAYFISSGDPRPQWEIVDGILGAAGCSPVERRLPLWAARAAAASYEALWTLLRRADEPPLTRFLVTSLTTAHWFDISAARRDLGFVPKVGFDEGLRRLKASLALG